MRWTYAALLVAGCGGPQFSATTELGDAPAGFAALAQDASVEAPSDPPPADAKPDVRGLGIAVHNSGSDTGSAAADAQGDPVDASEAAADPTDANLDAPAEVSQAVLDCQRTCTGCCASDGSCVSGNDRQNCGRGGAACVICPGKTYPLDAGGASIGGVCQSGVCIPPPDAEPLCVMYGCPPCATGSIICCTASYGCGCLSPPPPPIVGLGQCY